MKIPAGASQVWDGLSDPYLVIDCVPGAEIHEQLPDGTYRGTLTVGFGPLKVAFGGSAAVTMDDSTRTGVVEGRGKDSQGGTRFRTTIRFELLENDSEAACEVDVRGTI